MCILMCMACAWLAQALHAACALAAMGLGTRGGGVLYAATRGLASGLVSPCLGLSMPYFFGTRRLGARLGRQTLFVVLGTCVGALAVGSSPTFFGEGVFWPALVAQASASFGLAAMMLTLRRSPDLVD